MRMSVYYFGICHDCKEEAMYEKASMLTYLELYHRVFKPLHEGHNTEMMSEFGKDDLYYKSKDMIDTDEIGEIEWLPIISIDRDALAQSSILVVKLHGENTSFIVLDESAHYYDIELVVGEEVTESFVMLMNEMEEIRNENN
jgi:hypothetical protein